MVNRWFLASGATERHIQTDCSRILRKRNLSNSIIKRGLSEANMVSCITYENIQDEMKDWLLESVDTKYVNLLTNDEKIIALNRILLMHCMEHFYFSKYPCSIKSIFDSDIAVPALCTLIDKGVENSGKTFLIGSSQTSKIIKIAELLNIKPDQIIKDIIKVGHKVDENDCSDNDNNNYCNIHLISSANSPKTIFPLMLGKAKGLQGSPFDTDNSAIWLITCYGLAELKSKTTFNEIVKLSKLEDFNFGGTIHVILNHESESNLTPKGGVCKYLKKLAESLNAPIVHVHADDVVSVMNAMVFAADYRALYKKDIIVDFLFSNINLSIEENSVLLSNPIKSFISNGRFPLFTSFKNELIKDKIISRKDCDDKRGTYLRKVIKVYSDNKESFKERHNLVIKDFETLFPNKVYNEPITGIGDLELKDISKALCNKPSFNVSVDVDKLTERRKRLVENNSLDWELGECIAYARLLKQGVNIILNETKKSNYPRFIIRNKLTGNTYNQLEDILPLVGKYETSEYALTPECVAGIQIGYATVSPNTLNIWEVPETVTTQQLLKIIQEYLNSGKNDNFNNFATTFIIPHNWQDKNNSNKPRRIHPGKVMEICQEIALSNNMAEQYYFCNAIVANISTPANLYHILLRQGTNKLKRPLLLFVPNNFENASDKHLSSQQEILDNTCFQPYISDPNFSDEDLYEDIKHILLCTGKIYHSLIEERSSRKLDNKVPIVRIEQIMPFPCNDILKDIEKFPNATIWWAEEEDFSNGWWSFVETRLCSHYGSKIRIKFAAQNKTNFQNNEELMELFTTFEEPTKEIR